jgi:hypothetical protein
MSDWAEQRQSVILCEGFHDRAFWKGWLTHLGCTDLGARKRPIKDPWDVTVAGKGKHAYRSRSGKFVLVAPCDGKDNILPAMTAWLDERDAKPITRLVVNVDADVNADGTPSRASPLSRTAIVDRVRKIDSTMTEATESSLLLDNGATEVALVRWEANDALAPGLPNQQTLERLVCAAQVAAYPERGTCVHNWFSTLHEPPQPLQSCVKEYAWSYMAGWYAGQNCEAFYSCLWSNDKIAAELKSRLQPSGAWQIVESLAT